MEVLSLFIEMTPVAKARPRVCGNRTYTPKKTKDAEELIQDALFAACAQKKFKPSDKALNLHLVFSLKRPKSVPLKVLHPTRRPDIDNFIKLVMDAGNGLAWEDDSQIVKIVATKCYSQKEGIMMWVHEA